MSYYGSEKAVEHYNVSEQVKATLEGAVRGLELGPKRIRVDALSPGPGEDTRRFRLGSFPRVARPRFSVRTSARLHDLCAHAAFLVSDAASSITGSIKYVDVGPHIIG